MNNPVDFKPSWAKIEGANSNIDRLRSLTSPLDRSLYEVVSELKRGSFIYLNPPVYYQLTYRPKEEIPVTLANIVGHVFGDLRSALDYTAKRIGIARIPNFDAGKAFYFPAAPRKDLPTHSSLAAIDKAVPGFKKLLLEKIRPEDGPNEHLWDFATMGNENKHSDFIPTVGLVRISGINATIGTNRFYDCAIAGDAAHPQILIRSYSPVTIENNFQTTIDVKFGKGTPFENDSVIPTLFQIRDVVSKALKAIERLVNGP